MFKKHFNTYYSFSPESLLKANSLRKKNLILNFIYLISSGRKMKVKYVHKMGFLCNNHIAVTIAYL